MVISITIKLRARDVPTADWERLINELGESQVLRIDFTAPKVSVERILVLYSVAALAAPADNSYFCAAGLFPGF